MIRISTTHISPYSIPDCGGDGGFISIFNTDYNIRGNSSCGSERFWGGFGVGAGQAVASFIYQIAGILCNKSSGSTNCGWGSGSGNSFSGFWDSITNIGNGSVGGIDFGNAFEHFWDNIVPPQTSIVSNTTNKDTKKLEDFEKEVKKLEDKTTEEKAKDEFKTNVQELYDKIAKAKKESDNIDKTSDDEKYDKLLTRLKTLGAVESSDVEDPEDLDEEAEIESRRNPDGTYNVCKISDELKRNGYEGTANKHVVKHTQTKTFYKLKDDGTVGEKIEAPAPYKIISANPRGTFNAETEKASDGTWKHAIVLSNGQLKESDLRKNVNNTTTTIYKSSYKYNADGSYIETRTITATKKVEYYRYSKAGAIGERCDKDGNTITVSRNHEEHSDATRVARREPIV